MLWRNWLNVTAAFVMSFSITHAYAGQTITETGAIALFVDKWDEKEEAGNKLVDYSGRCVLIPDDTATSKATCACTGKYEYKADGSWTGSGTCTDTVQGGDQKSYTWQEGSQLKEYTYQYTGGTGKFKGATGQGTYFYESLTDTLQGGKYKGTIVLP